MGPSIQQASALRHAPAERLSRPRLRHSRPVGTINPGSDLHSHLFPQIRTDFHDPLLITLRLPYPAQQDSFFTSLSNVCAASFSPSTVVRYGKTVSDRSSMVRPQRMAKAAV